MGYACPVCDTPQRDAEHLANHLAFTAMLRGGDHEAWLDDQVPEWEELEPSSLADRAADHAESATYDEVFEDTTEGDDHGHGPDHGQGGDHAHGRDHGRDTVRQTPAGRGYDATADAEETENVLAEARRLTAAMYDDGDDTTGDSDAETTDGDDDVDTADGDDSTA